MSGSASGSEHRESQASVTLLLDSSGFQNYAIGFLGARSHTALVFAHGAGLDPLAPLYRKIASGLAPHVDVYLVGLRASGFINYDSGFRRPRGWAYHVANEAAEDYNAWVAAISERGYDRILAGGHSWGALLALGSEEVKKRATGLVLISPLPSLRDMIDVNFGGERLLRAQFDIDHLAADHLIPTREGSPLSFISAGTIRSVLSAEWTLRDFLERRKTPGLVLVGSKEHAQLKEAALSLEEPERQVRQIEGEGHFYTSGDKQLVTAIVSWWHSLAPNEVTGLSLPETTSPATDN